LSHVEYGTGQTYDLKRFSDKAHRHGAVCVVDATQSAGQVPIDVSASGVDAVATSCYKWLCGPFGTGFMYVSPTLQNLKSVCLVHLLAALLTHRVIRPSPGGSLLEHLVR
ncbi:MAG: aminotransferase class V-fold PLP-dependent enzyme, partial [Proteobacteria bacterium]|nr:aminotransferase class V-fold PLP-dependent enzyme [Pseudomonadota bacterium]